MLLPARCLASTQVKAESVPLWMMPIMDWKPISTAPFDRDLELAVFDTAGQVHALVFPCRRILGRWMNSQTKQQMDVRPTHWRAWQERR